MSNTLEETVEDILQKFMFDVVAYEKGDPVNLDLSFKQAKEMIIYHTHKVGVEAIGKNMDTSQVHVNTYPTWWDAVNGKLEEQRQRLSKMTGVKE